MIRLQIANTVKEVETAQDVVDMLREHTAPGHALTVTIIDGAIGPSDPDTLVIFMGVEAKPTASTGKKK